MSSLARHLERLPEYLGQHLLLSLAALALGIALSVPAVLGALRWPALRGPLLAAASTVQTIPGLALLALMVPLLGRIGFLPALLALAVYAVLPVLRNAVTGILGVDAAVVKAARGLGMTRGQILRRVQVPLASAVILAGIRTAAVWVVGMATLSTPVGATSLGNFIFTGLQTQDHVAVVLGCVAAAALALALDLLIRAVELAVGRRRPRLLLGSLALLVALVVAGIAPRLRELLAPTPHLVVGGKPFTEQYVLGELLVGRLQDARLPARSLQNLGSTVLFDALVAGRIDCCVDYSGTIWTNHMQGGRAAGRQEVLEGVREWLARRHGVLCMGSLGFENAYALAMPTALAEQLRVRTLAELAAHAPRLRIGGDYEFFGRPEWEAVRKEYGLHFAEQRTFDPTLLYAAVAEGLVDVISAYSTDGRIAAFELAVLEDPVQALPPYDAVLLLSPAAAQRAAVRAALAPLVGALDAAAMREANRQVDLAGLPPAAAAGWLRRRIDLR